MKRLGIFIALFAFSLKSECQVVNDLVYTWAVGLSSGSTSIVTDTKVDVNKNIYVYGEFNGTVDFDPSGGVDNRTAVGGYDVYVSKYDLNGTYLWTITVGGASTEAAADGGLEVDQTGTNLYLVGEFLGTVDFNPTATVENKTSVGGSDVFLMKISTAGVYQYTKTIGGTGFDDVGEVKMHATGVVFSGRFAGTVDFDPNAGVNNLVSNGVWDQYMIKLSSAGNISWVRQWDFSSDRENLEIRTDALNNIYFFGEYTLTSTDMDPGAGTTLLSSLNTTQGNLFYIKLNNSGVFVSANSYNIPTTEVSAYVDMNYEIHLSLRAFGVVNNGLSSFTTVGSSSGVLMKLSNVGVVLNSTVLDNTGADNYGVMDKVFDNGNNYFYVLLESANGANGFTSGKHIAKYDLSHNYVYSEKFSNQLPLVMCVDADGSVIVTGQFMGTNNFDFNAVHNLTTSAVFQNMFVSKYDSYTNLPVEMNSFGVLCNESKLYWETASEHNSSYYKILSSVDGINWEEMGVVSAAGNSNQLIRYEIPFNSNIRNGYYLIEQYDIDGMKKVYGPISSCKNLTNGLFPNPNSGEFYLSIKDRNVTVKIYDLMGHICFHDILNDEGTYLLNNLDLKPGVYFVNIAETDIIKFVVQ